VDDILLAASQEKFLLFLSYHDRLKFTIEYEKNKPLNFLNLLLIIQDNTLIIDLYHKEIFSRRFFSYFSNDPHCHKIDTIYGLTDRAILLSHPQFHNKHRVVLYLYVIRQRPSIRINF